MSHPQETLMPAGTLSNHFAEIVPSLSPAQAVEEASRCLFCYDAPCTKACPTHINVPAFIKKIATGNLKGSASVILEANPIGATCARVCPTETLCEGACVLNHASEPIKIGLLQRYVMDWTMQNQITLFEKGSSTGLKVAIIGAGPSGLAAARELARLGYVVTIFEAKEKAGGLSTYAIPPFRLPQEIPLWEVEMIENLGVEIKTNTVVGKEIGIAELKEEYQAIILAIGLGDVPLLGIEGEDLNGVYDAIAFIEAVKVGSLPDNLHGKKVVVIGAGNTAIDAAISAVRLGAESVTIVYRRTQKEMSAYPFEYELAKQEGINFRWLRSPKRIVGDEKVERVILAKMRLVQPENSDKVQVAQIEGEEEEIEADIFIRAIGQNKRLPLIEQFGLTHQKGVVQVDSSYQTSMTGVYAIGDCIYDKGNGEAMVVEAAQQGKQVAYAIDSKFNKSTIARRE